MNMKNVVLMISLAAVPFLAQSQNGKVLKPQDITESALIDALAPPTEMKTRSIRVMADSPPGGAATAQASAALLITFETNSANLTQRAKQSLDVVGKALSSERLAPFRFAIEGHADPRGAPDANLHLSQARAESVRQYLVKSTHVENGRLDAVGKGDRELINKANPIAPENRRVTIVNLAQ
ncbi:OmpA family protein [Pseudoduganella sp. UC29_106]|uniref:OmpA family protein n=1 Tax=Pseudoduganella sp. UC29_106 TaxID=3374553 RepID=UPI00375811ED